MISKPPETQRPVHEARAVLRDEHSGLLSFAGIYNALVKQGHGDHRQGGAVALLHLSGLDRYNDANGYSAGDEVIRTFARNLERSVRGDLGAPAMITRVHGCRFAVVVRDFDVSAELVGLGLRAIATSLAEDLAKSSVGMCNLRLSSGSIDPRETADQCLSRLARQLAAPRAVIRQLDVESAIRNGEISVRFQPQLSLADDALIGAEALARWRHPKIGELGGAALFAAAQQAGMQGELSHHVWQLAFVEMSAWPDAFRRIRIAINVTANDLADPAFAAKLLQGSARYGITPERLCIEVTESVAIAQPDQAAASLSALRRAGMHVALDDFGTGYSGLAWLKSLPVDYIKIDSGFAQDAGGAARDEAVLRGVIQLARQIDLDVLAEGVETEQQRDVLLALGCRWYQGFLKAPPLTSIDFVAFAKPLLAA